MSRRIQATKPLQVIHHRVAGRGDELYWPALKATWPHVHATYQESCQRALVTLVQTALHAADVDLLARFFVALGVGRDGYELIPDGEDRIDIHFEFEVSFSSSFEPEAPKSSITN